MAHRDTHRHIGTQKTNYELKSQNYQNLRMLQGAVYGKNDAHKILLAPMQQEGLEIKGSQQKSRGQQL